MKGKLQPVRRQTAFSIVGLLKTCAAEKDLIKGLKIHAYLREHTSLEKHPHVACTLVNMYVKCGAITKAQQVVEELPVRNVVMWNALIAGYAQQGQGEEALKYFDSMQQEGHSPNVVTFTCALKACGSIGAATKGKQIHDNIVRLGMLAKNIALGSILVDMYAKCGAVTKAHQVLKELPFRDVVTWSALIAGYVQQGQGQEALECFDNMQQEGHCADEISFTFALKACGSIGATAKGEDIHANIVSLGLLEKNFVLGSALVDMYARCGALSKAQQVLDELPVRNLVAWSALIAGYTQHNHGEEALKCFDGMQNEGHSPDAVTFTCALKACGNIGAFDKGKRIHDQIISLDLLRNDNVLQNTLVEMYAKCGAVSKAQEVLEQFPVRGLIMWNVLIAGYAQQGKGEEALECFDSLQRDGHSPDMVTFIGALKACGSIGAVSKGKHIHKKIVSLGMLEKSIVLGNTLVDMYAKCGLLAAAEQVLKELPLRDAVTWNALIAGYTQHGQGEEALKCFDSMQQEGHLSDVVTLTCALKACAIVAAASKGEKIHEEIVSLGMMEKNIELGNTLVDMYAKCGALAKALEVLKELPLPGVVTWNVLIGGYAQQGQSSEALNVFETMQSNGVMPDLTSLICALNAFSHSGLLDQADVFFSRMSTEFGLTPGVEHYCCMVDLFGRAGNFCKVFAVIEKMPIPELFSLWVALLDTCRRWEKIKIGRLAFSRALQLDKSSTAVYLCMAKIYIAAGMREDADMLEAVIKLFQNGSAAIGN